MRVAFFSSHALDRQFFDRANTGGAHELHYLETRLTPATCALAAGFPVVCPFVNDRLNAEVLARLAFGGAQMIALRSAGFNHLDVKEAKNLGFTVSRVPAYSPHSVAEHTIALIVALNRKIYRAYSVAQNCPQSPSFVETPMTDTLTDRDIVARIRVEYLEMSGLRLTITQAARLFNLEVAYCAHLLDGLVTTGVLWTDGREFLASNVGRRCA